MADVTRESSSAAYSIVCDHSGTVCDVYMHADKSLESVPGRRCISCRCVEFRFLISAVMSCTTGVTHAYGVRVPTEVGPAAARLDS